MFASARSGGQNGGSDDDDWLRVGRSFKGESRPAPAEENVERALQVYKKPKHTRRSKRSDSDSERESRKRKKKAKKKEGKRHRKSRRRSRSRSESDSSGDSDRSRSKKRRHRAFDDTSKSRAHALARRVGRSEQVEELALIEDPAHGELEEYSDFQSKQSGSERLFEYDCIGDPENSFYGSLYAHEQPLYHLATKRSVVDGVWITHKTNPHQSQRLSHQKADGESNDRYFGPAAKKMERTLGTKRLHLAYSQRRLARLEKTEGTKTVDELTFIPLDAVVDGEVDGIDIDYSELGDPPTESGLLLWQTDLENIERFITAQQKQLSERVSTNPQDIDGWLDLVAFQEHMNRLIMTKHRGQAKGDSRIFEKQKAICTKALDKNPASRQLHQLQLNLLLREQRANESMLDSDSCRAHLERLLDRDRSNVDLWMKLIQSSSQRFGSFSMTMLRDLYARTISVLNKELINRVTESAGESSRDTRSGSNQSFVHVIGSNSLLQHIDRYDVGALDTQTLELSRSLLEVHHCFIRAEVSAGYLEGAISHMQALIAFNRNTGLAPRDRSHHRLLERFIAYWNTESLRPGEDVAGAKLSPFYPSNASLELLREKKSHEIFRQCSPPEQVRSPAHAADLLGPFGASGRSDNLATVGDDSVGIDSSDDTMNQEDKWVYSNLHGQRIWVAHADDSHEYEKILDELRGCERFHARQRAIMMKELSREGKQALIIEQLRDERSDYPQLDVINDQYVQWLVSESQAEMTQWQPLRASNPRHVQMIESQPDRAILTEEILPFVFRVPRSLHLQMFFKFMETVGVRVACGSYEADRFAHIYSSEDLDDVPLLAKPILAAFEPTDQSTITLSSNQRYDMLMRAINQHVEASPLAVIDCDRVRFIRSIFLLALTFFENDSASATQIIKAVWLEYEAEVIAQAGDKDCATKAFRTLSQHLLMTADRSNPASIDTCLIGIYAAAEYRLGNERHAARTCDKTMATVLHSTGEISTSVCRSFHRLVFLRSQQALESDDGVLGYHSAFFVLWKVWHPESQDTLESILKKHRNKETSLQRQLSDCILESSNDVVARYRLELHIALDQCSETVNNCMQLLSTRCNVPFALANLCTAVYVSKGFEAARQEYTHFLCDAVVAKSDCHSLQCYHMYLAFLQRHQASRRSPILAPRYWREAVAGGLSRYPLDPLLLRLFVDAETSNTTSQSLRRYFQARRRIWERSQDSPAMIEWLFALLCEIARAERGGAKYVASDKDSDAGARATCCVLHRWGKNRPAVERIRRVFEEMVGQSKTSGSPIGWRLYLRFELVVGKVESARRVFYRALARCPWSKALYLDGLSLLRPYLSQEECKEITGFLEAKELHVRVDF